MPNSQPTTRITPVQTFRTRNAVSNRRLWFLRPAYSLLAGFWIAQVVCHCPAQSKPVELDSSTSPSRLSELDTWRGSSLGIRLEVQDEELLVSDIYPHVESSTPFLKGDRILSIGDLEFSGDSTEGLGELLEATDPDSELKAVVERNGQRIQLNVTTFRKEFVDIQAIFRRLHGNRIIQQHLKETNRENLFDDFTERMAISVQNSESPRQAAEALNRIIDEIDVSHTAIIPASAGLSFSQEPAGSIGIVLQRHRFDGRDRYFVVDRQPGGPSYRSELKLGDEILVVNGVAIEQSSRLLLSGHEDRYQLFTLKADVNEELEIEFLRSPFEDSRVTVIKSELDLPIEESVRQSVRTIASGNRQIGYLRFWNLMSMKVNSEFSRQLAGEFARCDAIIMDLRGRGGIVPVVSSLNRTVKNYDKPVVVIIDDLTRSAKEMLAHLLKKHDHVVVVGAKTAGAVTGATMQKLPSGNTLMYPVASAETLKQYIDGQILEGIGVEPDERVKYFVPWSGGEDRLFDYAVKRAAEFTPPNRDVIGR